MDDFSTEGGELVIFSSDEKEYRVFDFWLYGETGKLNYTYWTNKANEFLFTRRVTYNYDRPYYEEGFQIDTLIHYLSFGRNANTLYGKNGHKILSKQETEAAIADIASFFDELTATIEVPK